MEQVIKMVLHRSDLTDSTVINTNPDDELSPNTSINVIQNLHNPNYMDTSSALIHFINNPLANAINLSGKTFRSSFRKPTIYTSNVVRPTPTTILNLPQRLLRWIYSMSMVLFILLMLAFIAVTPLDVIVQTLGSSNDTAIKTFIVIIVCVVFLLVLIIIYLARVYQFRIYLNDIPTKSLYIPAENDFSKPVYDYIDKNLQKCSDIKFKAGPLEDENCIINHPGLSPPEYIQKINSRKRRNNNVEGTLLPPNVHYEDIIRSLGDKFYMGKILTQDDLPIELSMKEIIIYLSKQCMEVDGKVTPNINRLIELYENFRFNSKLITEQDIFEFMIEFDKFGQICQNDYQLNFPQPSVSRRMSRISHSIDFNSDFFRNPSGYSNALFDDDEQDDYDNSDDGCNDNDNDNDNESDDFYYYRQQRSRRQSAQQTPQDERSLVDEANPFHHLKVENKYFSNATGDEGVGEDSMSVKRLGHRESFNSSRSVIRNKLALDGRHTFLNMTTYEQDDDDDNDVDTDEGYGSSLHRNRSGYVTDEEASDSDSDDIYDYDGEQQQQEEEEEEEEEDHEQFYQFRRRKPVQPYQVQQQTDLNISSMPSIKSVEVKNIHK